MGKLDSADWTAITAKTEEKLVSDGKLAQFFEDDIENLYPTVQITYKSDENVLTIKMKIETDGTPRDSEEIDEQINDYIMDGYLSPEMEAAGIDLDDEDYYDSDPSLDLQVLVELLPVQD
mgnify:CR=1 FL=1